MEFQHVKKKVLVFGVNEADHLALFRLFFTTYVKIQLHLRKLLYSQMQLENLRHTLKSQGKRVKCSQQNDCDGAM